LTLTEVVYKIRSHAYPLCAFTEANPQAKVLVNQISFDDQTRLVKLLVTVTAPEATTKDLLANFESIFKAHELVRQGKDTATYKVTTSLDQLKDTKSPHGFALEYFGERAIVQPSLVKHGYFNTRLIVLGKVDLAEMLQQYESGVNGGRWDDFKLIRIDDFDPEQQITGAFAESLTQKQLEVIKTALALGFYNTPRNVTLDDLSNIFGISKAAVHNRLQAAERKVIARFFS
jgi:predicted DNA binding protein